MKVKTNVKSGSSYALGKVIMNASQKMGFISSTLGG